MKTMRPITILAVLAIFAAVALAPAAAFASQSSKNMWRNLAIGSGVVAGYGLLNHNSTATWLGAAGAGYSLYRYEQDRKSQSAAARARARYWYRHYYAPNRRHYHRSYSSNSYVRGSRKYYTFDGHRYYENLHTGARYRM